MGITAELYIGGVGLARGYLKQPDLTAEKFIPHPFSAEPGARLYKTGDLARYLADGNIEFLGRIDHQVKIRGFRIELGEIETALSRHPAVREAVVVAREESLGDKRLVAYAVFKACANLGCHCGALFLKGKAAGVHGAIGVCVFGFSSADSQRQGGSPSAAGARTESVRAGGGLCWPAYSCRGDDCRDLGRSPESSTRSVVHDNFFDLGGHSLLATQVMSRIREGLQVEIPLRVLFERPTVAELATRIEESYGQDRRLSAPPMVAVLRDKHLPLSFSQQRLWFLDQYEPNSSVYNVPGALRLRGSLDIGALEQSLNEIIRRHESLRTTFSMVDGEPVQVIAPPVELSLSVVDLRDHPEGEREEEAQRLANEEARRPFDLAQGPLFRSKLLRLGEDDHVLLLTMHHIVSDGWSMGVLHRELSVSLSGIC